MRGKGAPIRRLLLVYISRTLSDIPDQKTIPNFGYSLTLFPHSVHRLFFLPVPVLSYTIPVCLLFCSVVLLVFPSNSNFRLDATEQKKFPASYLCLLFSRAIYQYNYCYAIFLALHPPLLSSPISLKEQPYYTKAYRQIPQNTRQLHSSPKNNGYPFNYRNFGVTRYFYCRLPRLIICREPSP